MDQAQTIAELCGICEAQNRIILAQAEALGQVGAMVMEEERAAAAERFEAVAGKEKTEV